MGQVIEGYIRLSGHLRPHSGKDRRPRPTEAAWIGDWYDTQVYQPPELLQQERYLVPFTSENPFKMNDETEWHAQSIRGIILEAVPGEPDTFQRLGTFTHPWGSHRTPEEVALYPEFDNFDFEDFERQVITLI